MEGNIKNTNIRRKVSSMRRRSSRRSYGIGENSKKRPSCLNLNKGEKLPSVWPKTTKQQAYRNYQRMDQMSTVATNKNSSLATKRNRKQSLNHVSQGKSSKRDANKSTIHTVAKEKKTRKQKDSAPRPKYPKNNDINNTMKKKFKVVSNNKKEYSTTHNSSACRSNSKLKNKMVRKNSKLKVKRTARHPKARSKEKTDLQTQGRQGQPKSNEKSAIKKNTEERQPVLKSKLNFTKSRTNGGKIPNLYKKSGVKSKSKGHDHRGHDKDKHYHKRDLNHRHEARTLSKHTKRSMTKNLRKNESSNFFPTDIFHGLGTSLKELRKKYGSSNKLRSHRTLLLPKMFNKNNKVNTNEGSASKTRINIKNKRGSVYKGRICDKSLTKVNSQSEYGFKIKRNRSCSQSSTSKCAKGKHSSQSRILSIKGIKNLSVLAKKVKERAHKSFTKRKTSVKKLATTHKNSINRENTELLRTDHPVFKTSIKRREEFIASQENYSSTESEEESQEKEEVSIPNLDSDEEKEESPNREINFANLVPEKQCTPKSPLLLPQEKKLAKDLGYSLDTKLQNDEFFFIDLENMCFCLSIAIHRKITFSRGFLFLEDLEKLHKRKGSVEKDLDASDLSMHKHEINYSYCFPDQVKLDLADQYISNKEDLSRCREETCSVKKALDMDEEE
ncbi:unnamed protein product [Moneuplotes crassus]|uniref:Uncharacterized protein n=1 Tax=Euplotes crassus TaxID=5936 RepID=A0AAD1XL23_EUPCR|nr:unnamed protein product [Moneuplotes crassus]